MRMNLVKGDSSEERVRVGYDCSEKRLWCVEMCFCDLNAGERTIPFIYILHLLFRIHLTAYGA
ncbi:unnamed protein product [Periconia digitata]|uniref:Uncharacterized protein n=1 Tax=Periconia digitata TaxID=1303443 RepID=A0A9W4U5X6_9PLEO|nr:unnamed protein product [Periconia digitata]